MEFLILKVDLLKLNIGVVTALDILESKDVHIVMLFFLF